MIKKIIISTSNNIAAIINNSKIQELIIINDTYQINDIYIGIVQKIFTSINAAFIKLNYSKKSGFIHISDTKYLYDLKNSSISTISNTLFVRQKILVQIIKEPTNTKGPRLTTNIHLSGQYLTLMPLNNTICVGQKIYDENERSFLRALGILIKPFKMGILFKESSVGITEKILIKEIQNLTRQWNFIEKSVTMAHCPTLLYQDKDIIQKILRDYCKKDIEIIITDSKSSLQQIHEYLITNSQTIPKNHQLSLQLYKSNTCILEKFQINSVIFNILKSKVELGSGIYIFIESSEALTTIDVNSGSFNDSGSSQDSLLKTNCLAATEIAYQLKIRNINGIIIIDFIDMKSHNDQLILLEHLNKSLKYDDGKPEIIQLSELGLVELTRRRRGKSIKEVFASNTRESNKKNNEAEIQRYGKQYHKDHNYTLNINTVFFKKRFNRNLKIYHSSKKRNTFIPLHQRYIIPVDLYYSTIDPIVLYN
uniref:Ribonuclease E n=1 Tax=Helminthocladia australis TaxID=260093 RepID=A0A1G4NT82_9FLOR|nr:Ribonuclease E [Helminthocladia australis]SCW21870.1 Ribonuclease E [Helminthocladia australis]